MTYLRSRAPRRDATRNRERLLAAARAVFAEHGYDVALEEIARVAEVSRTTLYRNFTSREELAAAVAQDGLEQIERHAAALHADPLGALALFNFVLDLQLSTRSLAPFLSRSDSRFAQVAERTAEAFRPLVDHAADAGTLRSGVDLLDVLLAIQMTEVFATETDPSHRARRHARARRLLFRGLFTDSAVQAFFEASKPET